MASARNEERITKSEGVKIVKMKLSEDDIRNAAVDRLREIQRELESALPASIVFLTDMADMMGFANTTPIQRRAKNMKISIYTKRQSGSKNKASLCVSEEDAEKIMRSLYEN